MDVERKAGARSINAHDQVVLLLAKGTSIERAASLSGLSARTIYRRLADPKFTAKVNQVRTELFEAAYGQLVGSLQSAVTTLKRLLRDEASNVQLAAAKALLDFSGKLKDSVELSERLERIEEHLKRQEFDERQFEKSG